MKRGQVILVSDRLVTPTKITNSTYCKCPKSTYSVYCEKCSYRWAIKEFLSFRVNFEQSFEANMLARSGLKFVSSSTLEGHGCLAFSTTLSGLGLKVIDFLGTKISIHIICNNGFS